MRSEDMARLTAEINRPVIRILPYIDTAGLWLPYTPRCSRTDIEAEYGRRVRIEECKWGYRVPLHQPSKQILPVLDDLQREHRAVLSWLDIAVDLTTRTSTDADRLKDWLVRRLSLLWCRSRCVRIVTNRRTGATTIYFDWENKHRNLAIYSDRPSKLTGEPCCHIELRLRGAQTCRRNDLQFASYDLLELDPRWLFDKHVRLLGSDAFVGAPVEVADGPKYRIEILDRRLQRIDAVPLSAAQGSDMASPP